MSERFEVKPEEIPAIEDIDEELRTDTKKLLGSVLFPAGWCRPDLSCSVIKVARHAHQPSEK
eukprot:3901013-Rhodomonas_salina.1